MNLGLLAASALAGAAYTITPGPAFLMLLGIGAAQGRSAVTRFVGGHLAGDLTWSSLALVAIIGAREIGSTPFDLLGIVCGLYLGWLGLGALRYRADRAGGIMRVARPGLRGFTFGMTNPKGYPVAVATFTALLAGQAEALSWAAFPALLAAAFFGFLCADVILVLVAGAARVRAAYQAHETVVVRLSGLIFLGFAAAALHAAAPNLIRLLAG